jgi:hypothetical protein
MIAVGLAVHAMKTGRPQWWLYILIFVPVIGSIAYIVAELLPAMAETRRARAVRSNIGTILDPNREWRERVEQAELVDSADAKRALAEECERKGMWADAIRLYEKAAIGIFADDPVFLIGLARAQLGNGDANASLATLDKLRAAHPTLQSQEAHLLYARALEASGRIAEALEEYMELSRYYAGFEARARYGLLLLKEGQPDPARELFQEVLRAAKARPVVVTSADREWIKVARANLN